MKKFMIYNSDILENDNEDYYNEVVESEVIDKDDVPYGSHKWMDFLAEEKNYAYDDETANLNIPTKGKIIGIGSVGLWDGRHHGFMEVGDNVNNVLDRHTSGIGDIEVYVEGEDIQAIERHHDGTNYYTFRELNTKYDDEKLDDFMDKLYQGKATEADIDKYTLPMGHYPAEVYGWKLEKKPKAISAPKDKLQGYKMPKQANLNKMSKGY